MRVVATLLRGWKAYFRYGYPRRIFRTLNYYVQVRFRCFLRNRSQRRSRPFRQGESLYAGLQRYGLATCDGPSSTLCVGLATTRVGEPDAGNLHVRFDEGEQLTAAPYSTVVVSSCPRPPEAAARRRRRGHEGSVRAAGAAKRLDLH